MISANVLIWIERELFQRIYVLETAFPRSGCFNYNYVIWGISPVNIGAGSLIGAGSVVTNDSSRGINYGVK